MNSNTGSWNAGMNKEPTGGWNNDFAFRNYQSRLPEVYTGHPNRIERYNQYEMMDVDPEINACLDILSEFSTQMNEHNNTPFEIQFNDDPTTTEVELVVKQLQQWCKLNELDTRIFKIFRNTVKYGDQVFVRDPENFKLYWTDMTKVVKVIVNESEGKKPEQYVIKDINPNLQNLSIAEKTTTDFQAQPPTAGYSAPYSYTVPNEPYGTTGSRFSLGINEAAIDAKHVVHLSLTEGLDRYWPFGQSILENIFKVYKQKELLEDAILIYRVQRAPERRIFKIDVGNMPSHLAMAFVNRIKDEIHQRRIPSVHGGQSVMDATYNPLCLDLSTRIPLLDGRTLELQELIREFESGKENWTYSCDPVTGKVVPGVINWAGITRKNTEVIKVTLDNGKTLTCTPDHKIPVFGKGFVEAQNLTAEDSLIAFNVRNEKISGEKSSEYQQVWDHETREWVWTHRMVGEFFRKIEKHQEYTYLSENIGAEKTVIHHRDYNRFNNDPRNLTYMNKKDHILYHAAQESDFWKTMTEEYRAELTGKISETVKQNWNIMTEHERHNALYRIRAAQTKAVWLRNNDSEHAAKYSINASKSRKEYIKNNPAFAEQLSKNLENRVKFNNQKLTMTFDMLQLVVEKVKAHGKNKKKIIDLCSSDEKLLELVRQHNSEMSDSATQNKINLNQFGEKKINRLITQFGYKNWKHFVSSIEQFNHRVVSIERVSNRDTGTITIDGTERWHNYHTFAIDSGIFIKNSINEDYFFPVTADGRGSDVTTLPGGCFSMDTRVSLLDGRELSIAEIESEMKTGKQLWTYSCEPLTGKVVPGLITWAGVTKPRAKVLKITLDNGEHIICTPEHKFPVYEQEFKRADEFVVGDSMIPLYRKKEYLGKSKNEYEQYYDNEAKEWKFTHRTVADYLKDTLVCYHVHDSSTSNGLYEVRHHKDFNRFNNDPQNLCWMSFSDHIKYHADHNTQRIQIIKENNINEYRKICKNNSIAQKKRWENTTPEQKENFVDGLRQFWSNLTDEERQLITDKMSASIKKYIESLSEDDRESRAQNSRDAFKIASSRKLEKMRTDEEYHAWVCQQQSAGWTEKLREQRAYQTREWNYINWSDERGKERKKKHSDRQRVEYTHDMLKFVIDMVKGKTTHEVTADNIAAELNKSSLRDKLVELNKDKQVRNWKVEEGFTPGNIRRSLVQQFGYKSWKDFRVKESVHNHRVAALEWLEEEISVGTLTIDGDEIYHDYHTFALSVGVFTKNSNLGEIDDLRYFNNRLARGLRVPSSYLPTGPEDSERPLVDGKVGTALIQEYRFNQYCERLQGYIARKLNEEFKLFLRWRGFNIDAGLFDLKFNPPQNFAAYRQSEIDQVRVNVFNSVAQLPYISTRFAMERFLGLSQEEIKKNEKLWHEEHSKPEDEEKTAKGTDLRSIGLSTSDIESDTETAENIPPEGQEQMPGISPEVTAPVGAPPAVGPETAPPAI